MDMDANRIEARPDTGADAEKPAQINVSIDADRDLVKLDAKLGRPDPISNGLTGTKRRQGLFHLVRLRYLCERPERPVRLPPPVATRWGLIAPARRLVSLAGHPGTESCELDFPGVGV